MKTFCSFVLILLLCTPLTDVQAEDLDAQEAKELAWAVLDTLVEQGLLTRNKADTIIQAAKNRVALRKTSEPATPAGTAQPASTAIAATTPGTEPQAASDIVRVPYIPESLRKRLREEVRQDVMAQARSEGWASANRVPEWIDRIRLSGDLRLRYQRDMFNQGNSILVPNALAINQKGSQNINNAFLYTDGEGNVAPDRDRFRFRLRLGLDAAITDKIDVGLRLTTGNIAEPIQTNQTLGNYNGRYAFVIDRAYVHTHFAYGDIWAGRVPNPFMKSELIWAPELSFEGVAASLQIPATQTLTPFINLGIFPLQEIDISEHDKWLFAGQAGVIWQPSSKLGMKIGAAYYDYENITGIRNTILESQAMDYTAPAYLQKGNSIYNIRLSTDPNATLYALASKYRMVNLLASMDYALYGATHLSLTADFVKNIAWNHDDVLARSGLDLSPETSGYFIKLELGQTALKQAGDWQANIGYRWLQRDAVVDAFTDAEFHLGGTNTKGFTAGASYMFSNNAFINLRWMNASEVSGAPLAIDVLQIDLNYSF